MAAQQQQQQPEDTEPDYNCEPKNRSGTPLVRVVHLKCPFEAVVPNPCQRTFVNTAQDNRLVRQQLWSHLTESTVLGGHGFGQFVCQYTECTARTVQGRVYPNRRSFWAHISVHKNRDDEQQRNNPLFRLLHKTYSCIFCPAGMPFKASSQAAIHVHIAQRHHPGQFRCTQPDCRYRGSNEQNTVVQHQRNHDHTV